MQALGIPTSRALAITGSDQGVMRETVETSAVVTRLALALSVLDHLSIGTTTTVLTN
jgi:uncharacterized protein YdiU (UPF0061 family)